METKFAEIPDALWDHVEPLLPGCPPGPRVGRPPIPDRTILSGIVYRLRTGSQWKALPDQFGSGSACHARFQSWCVAGIFRRLFEKIVEFYEEVRGVEWEWAVTRPGQIRQTAASQASNVTSLPMVEVYR